MSIDTSQSNKALLIYQHRWWTLVILSMAWSVTTMGNSILNVAVPVLQRELEAQASQLQWMVDAYPLALAALLISMGFAGDRLGRAHALRAGVIIFAIGSILGIVSDSAQMVIAARVIMGIGGAAVMPATLAIIAQVFPLEERGKAISIWAGINGVSLAMGPIIGGLLVKYFAWQAIFVFNVPFVIIVATASIFLVPNSRNPNVQPLDIPGMLFSTAGLGTLVYGLIKAGDKGWTDGVVISWLSVAIIIIVLFVVWERHTAKPMLDIGLFRNSRYSMGAACILIVAFIYVGTMFGLTLYMQFVHGYSALETGIRFLPIGLGYVIGARTSNWQVVRIGIRSTVTVGLVLLATMLAYMSFWTADTAYWIMVPTLFAMAFFSSYVGPPSTSAIVCSVPVSRAGAASAMSPVASQVGVSIGVAVLGSIISTGYTSSVKTALAGKVVLSEENLASVRESVGSAIAVADKLPVEVGDTIRMAAHHSFMDGWQLMALTACAIAVTGAILAFKILPPQLLPQSGSSTEKAS